MMTGDELAQIEERLTLYDAGDRAALEAVLRLEDAARPIWYLDLADLLTDARLAREEITHLIAMLNTTQRSRQA